MINTAAISRLLTPTIKDVFGRYNTYPDQWKEIFYTQPSNRAFEFDVEMRYLGLAGIKPEGSPVDVDTMGERTVTNYIHRCVATSFNITKEALEDNQYQEKFPEAVLSLRDSLRSSKNILGANILNNAFAAGFPIGDGQALCSATHPIDGGVFSNIAAAPVAFSEAGLEAGIIDIQAFPTVSGLLSEVMPRKVLISRNNQFNASRVLQSTFRSATALNDINALYHLDYIPEGYKVNQFLTSTRGYFILTNAVSGLKHYQRTDVESYVYPDPQTFNIKFTAMERYSFGASNPRALWGSPGV